MDKDHYFYYCSSCFTLFIIPRTSFSDKDIAKAIHHIWMESQVIDKILLIQIIRKLEEE